MLQTDYETECHQQRMQTWPPRVNRTEYTTGAVFWLDGEGKRQIEILTAEPTPLIWRECARYPSGRFERILDGGETESKR